MRWLASVSGLVLTSRSPSCGVGSTPLFDTHRHEIGRINGLFTEVILQSNETMPVIEDKDLEDDLLLNRFINKVRAG